MKHYYLEYNSNVNVGSIWIVGGSDKDKKNKKGINQILSSLLIRGCKNFDNYKLSDLIDSYGADLYCETYEDGILLSLKCIKPYFKKVYPILKLIIEKPILSEEQFKVCQLNLINDIKKSKENPFNIAFKNWRKIVYKNHPYAHDCNGCVHNINNINHEDILDEYHNFKDREKLLLSNYYSKGMNNIESLVFNKSLDNKLICKEKNLYKHIRECKVHYQNTNQLIILLGNKTCSYEENDFINLKLLESYLAFGMSSKLFRVFRESNGLTYDAGVFNPLRKSSSPFLIYLSSSHSNSLNTFNHLMNLWNELTNQLITEKELDLAKTKLNAAISASSQTTEEVINRKVQLLGLKIDPMLDKKLIEIISKVGTKEVLQTSKKYLSNPYLSISGKKEYCDKIRSIWQSKI